MFLATIYGQDLLPGQGGAVSASVSPILFPPSHPFSFPLPFSSVTLSSTYTQSLPTLIPTGPSYSTTRRRTDSPKAQSGQMPLWSGRYLGSSAHVSIPPRCGMDHCHSLWNLYRECTIHLYGGSEAWEGVEGETDSETEGEGRSG